MEYVVSWQLVGRDERVLDSGILDSEHSCFGEAMLAATEFLRSYREVERRPDGTWRARRSSDADLRLNVRIRSAAENDSGVAADE